MILAPTLTMPDHVFKAESLYRGSPPPRSPTNSSRDNLLVCKRWLRVGTPHLYTSVIISSKEQADSLAHTLSHYADIGKFVKNLRIDGSYGRLGKILSSCPKLVLFALHLEIFSKDSVEGLCSGLMNINPKELVLLQETCWKNQKVKKVLAALSVAFPKWSNLVRHDFPL